jgi:hypothetical protein
MVAASSPMQALHSMHTERDSKDCKQFILAKKEKKKREETKS